MSNGTNRAYKRRWRGLAALSLLLGVVLSLAACSSAKSDQSSGAAAPAAMSDADMSAQSVALGNAEPQSKAVALTSTSTDAKAIAKTSAPEAGAGFAPIADSETGMNRKVIYKAQVTMKVPKFDSADAKVRDAIHLSGGYVLQFSNNVNPNEKGATYVIKVPADGFSSFIEQLGKIQKDLQLHMEGSDVTEEYVDLNARLQAKKTVEARLLAFMDKAKGSDDLVKFSSELASVQEQIEQIKGRMRYLDQNVAFSTVNLRLYEGKAELAAQDDHDDGLGERLTAALTGSARALGQFGQALLVFVAALLPVAAVAAVIGFPVYAVIRARRRTRPKTVAEAAAIPAAEPKEDGR